MKVEKDEIKAIWHKPDLISYNEALRIAGVPTDVIKVEAELEKSMEKCTGVEWKSLQQKREIEIGARSGQIMKLEEKREIKGRRA